MSHINSQAASFEFRYGAPHVVHLRWDANAWEFELLRRATSQAREHDITLLIARDDLFAVIQKPDYPPEIFRPPSGGVEPGESLETGARREAYEETGLQIALRSYLLRAHVLFERVGETDETIRWCSHVFLADWLCGEPRAVDTHEIAAARWATRIELESILQAHLDEAVTEGLRYRGWLQRMALRSLRARETTASVRRRGRRR